MQEPENETGFVIRDKRHSSFDDKIETPKPPESDKVDSATQGEDSIRQAESQTTSESAPGPVNFMSFILGMAQTALFQMGLIQIQGESQPRKDMNGARQTIDIIAMIEEKTRGNLTDDEKKVITDTLFQLRMAFVEISK